MSIIQIDDILVSSEIFTEYFSCDYQKCKGVCCIIGDSGAPLEELETQVLEREYPNYSPLMIDEAKDVIAQKGFFVIDGDGDMVTPLMKDGEECAYTLFDENENCFCSIEKSYFAGKTKFRKPISCWLYPIRISKLSSGMTALNLHRWDICKVAFLKGKKEEVLVYKFLKEPLIQCFGKDFYSALEEAAKSLTASS